MKRRSNIEYGLMTLSEYLEHRNPENKHHESGSYTFSVDSMNQDHSLYRFRFVEYSGNRFNLRYIGKKDLSAFFICEDNKVVAVAGRGTLYYTLNRLKNAILNTPLRVSAFDSNFVNLSELGLTPKKVKYPSDFMGLVSDVVAINTKRYPHLLERFENNEEMFTVRSEKPLNWGANEGVTIGIFNEQGFKVATAQDEWGATLIGVAEEYRSRGLSKSISKYWYRANPGYLSGGFTPQGEDMAISYWADRVRVLHTEGIYFEKVLKGEMTQDRVDEIMADLPPKVERVIENIKVKPTGTLAMNSDEASFVIYDLAYFQEQDDRFIYGYGLLRDSSDVGTFYYQLDYERKYSDLVTKVALQFAKNLGDTPLYDGMGDRYSDILEIEGIAGVVKRGDYIYVENDLIDLREMRLFDRLVRKKVDTYGEIETLLRERAYVKYR